MSIKETISNCFLHVLKRKPTTDDFFKYTNRLHKNELNYETLKEELSKTNEFKMLNTKIDDEYINSLNNLYKRLLKRNIDKDSRTYLYKLQNKKINIQEIENEIIKSKEYKNITNSSSFDDFCISLRKSLGSNLNSNYPLIDNFAVVCIEGRNNTNIDICTYITMSNFNINTPIYIFCTPDNDKTIKNSLAHFNLNIEYVLLNSMNDIDAYNLFLLSPSLWNFLKKKNIDICLIYQSDSFIDNDISSYIKNISNNLYDYIGAPHIFEDPANTYILNGGLSLRSVDAMLKALNDNSEYIITEPYIQNEDEFYSEFTNKAPLNIAKHFSFETLYDSLDISMTSLCGYHCFWKNNENDTVNYIFDILNTKYNSYEKYHKILDKIYMKLLNRHVDDCGVKAYLSLVSKNNINEVENNIKKSDEFLKLESTKRQTNHPLQFYLPKYPYKPHRVLFNVVVCRYKEDVSFLENFFHYPCHVFLYNKGPIISYKFKTKNISIINIPNIAFEDFAYLSHITYNYHNISIPIIFMQCSIDHSPYLFQYLDNFEKFSKFECLSSKSGTLPKNKLIKSNFGTYFETNEIDAKPIKDIMSIQFKNILTYLSSRYNINIVNHKKFAAGAYVYICNSCITKYPLDMYIKLLDDIKFIHSKDTNTSKLFAEILERYFWSSIWS